MYDEMCFRAHEARTYYMGEKLSFLTVFAHPAVVTNEDLIQGDKFK